MKSYLPFYFNNEDISSDTFTHIACFVLLGITEYYIVLSMPFGHCIEQRILSKPEINKMLR